MLCASSCGPAPHSLLVLDGTGLVRAMSQEVVGERQVLSALEPFSRPVGGSTSARPFWSLEAAQAEHSVLSQLFCVNAGSSLSIQTDLQPDKVASTCSERLAQLDPHCPPMLLAACKRSRAGADACRLSLAMTFSVAMPLLRFGEV